MASVKCPVCGKYFSQDKEPFIKLKNRYYHKSCYEATEAEKDEEEKEHELLVTYIKKLFNIKNLTPKINQQLKKYINDYHYSSKGIRLALIYWFEIKGNSIDKANGGVGIVPYCYEQSLTYWKSIEEVRELNKDVQKVEITVREIHIPLPERKPMKMFHNLFNFLEEGGQEEK